MNIEATVLVGHPFHKLTNEQIRAAICEASRVARAMYGVDPEAQGVHLGKMNDGFTILGTRIHHEKVA